MIYERPSGSSIGRLSGISINPELSFFHDWGIYCRHHKKVAEKNVRGFQSCKIFRMMRRATVFLSESATSQISPLAEIMVTAL